MVIELDGIVKLLGFAIAIPLTVCVIIAVNKTVDNDPDFNKLKFK